MALPNEIDILTRELAAVVSGDFHDPHQILGLHDTGDGPVIRAYRPSAEAVRVVLPGDPGMATVDLAELRDGLFAGPVPEQAAAGYQLLASYADGTVVTFEDPYRFPPTLGEVDLHLIGEGSHRQLWRVLGAHPRRHHGVDGTSFAVWAPNARSVRVVGDFNFWDGRLNPMRSLGSSGVWELFLPGVEPGARYKFEILTAAGHLTLKADPVAMAAVAPPGTDSIVAQYEHPWSDAAWLARRDAESALARPLSIYEVHLGSWRKVPEEGGRPLSYRELAQQLPAYVKEMGFTHVELMPVAEHPFSGSWGYQVSSYYAPTARFGPPDDFAALVDALHAEDIGVIVDWVPGHFPRDEWALARFDGTALYEHDDPRKGAHHEWGTLVFNYGRNEVRNFLVANANYWFEVFHIDGLRVDGVASMLYLDYAREDGAWVPNMFGGREHLEAVSFLRQLNEQVYGAHPGVMMIAEESTSWPAVSRPTDMGGLGFGLKWNMGWMHDTLDYFAKDPIHRRFHQNDLTFGMLYAFTENFVLPLSHDEVAHGKGSLLAKMPGDRWQKAANLRALLAWMWAHPGKQLLFMGGEIAQSQEWDDDGSVDWHLLQYPEHRGVQDLVRELNRFYRQEPALWELDFEPAGFQWIDANDADSNVLSFLRLSTDSRVLACIANLSPVARAAYRVGLPQPGGWREVLNSDAACFAGSNTGNAGWVHADGEPWNGQPHSALVVLPPLGVVWLSPA
ncbi:MAG TPA: 1,4-alpha-glucan branching protein GlgB [Acidimicrobiales bacterium]|jgi:1,4-alpha-glucan branching enzyme|nr:1,4-alpha-glucan branching protein GlgB [Acidimicrobiales bacterium]